MNYTMKLSKKLSFGEEIANSVTHAVGALLMPVSYTHLDVYKRQNLHWPLWLLL